jgi:hypothetical protein
MSSSFWWVYRSMNPSSSVSMPVVCTGMYPRSVFVANVRRTWAPAKPYISFTSQPCAYSCRIFCAR